MAKQAEKYLHDQVPVGEYLADQLLLPLALAGDGMFRSMAVSQHSLTNIETIKMFLDVGIEIVERETGNVDVKFFKNN